MRPGPQSADSPQFDLSSWGADEATWQLDAFGVHVRADLPLVGATPEAAGVDQRAPTASGHTVRISRLEGESPSGARAEVLLERVHPDGSIGMRVYRLDDQSYLVEAPGHGTFQVARDGSVIWYKDLTDPRWRWHRPLCAQVLPLAATLQGFELLHASAVVLGDRVIAFVAESGGGKTSLALALLARGASLVTDDVLALEAVDGKTIAHPGVPMANVAGDQMKLLSDVDRVRLGFVMGASDKVHVEVSNMPVEALQLGAVFFLCRSSVIDRLTFEPADPPDPRDLLAATFMPHIVTPRRLMTQLRTCAEVAANVPIFKLSAPAELPAMDLAPAVEWQVSRVLACATTRGACTPRDIRAPETGRGIAGGAQEPPPVTR